jgi:hypothetical protein
MMHRTAENVRIVFSESGNATHLDPFASSISRAVGGRTLSGSPNLRQNRIRCFCRNSFDCLSLGLRTKQSESGLTSISRRVTAAAVKLLPTCRLANIKIRFEALHRTSRCQASGVRPASVRIAVGSCFSRSISGLGGGRRIVAA